MYLDEITEDSQECMLTQQGNCSFVTYYRESQYKILIEFDISMKLFCLTKCV
jgi:hypothetical protein